MDVFTFNFSVSRFISLEQAFGNAGLSDVYSPWDKIDDFGKVQIRETLDSYEAIYQVVSEASVPWREYIVETLSSAKAQKASQSSLIRKSGSKDSLYHVNNFILIFFSCVI